MKNLKENTFLVIVCALFLWLIVTVLSCTPQRRLNYLLDRHPQLAQNDTLVYRDTINTVINGVHTDTIYSLTSNRFDTVVIKQDQLTIRTFVYKDSIYISGECDTIRETRIIEKHIPYEKFIYTEPPGNKPRYDIAIIIACIVIGIIFILKKFL